MTDESGRVAWRLRLSPFGEPIELDEDADGDGTPVTLNLRFPGQYYDAESGLHYNWWRYYDSHSGNYTTPDHARFSEFTTYKYAAANPMVLYDTTGRRYGSPHETGACCCLTSQQWDGDWWYVFVSYLHTGCFCNWRCYPLKGKGQHLLYDPSDVDWLANDGWSIGVLASTGYGDISRGSRCACDPPESPKTGVIHGSCKGNRSECLEL